MSGSEKEQSSTKRVHFAVDYDDCFTAAPELWKVFFETAKTMGHSIWIVSCRMDNAENRDLMADETGLEPWRIKLTSMGPKKSYCEEHSIPIDVWCDDLPESILYGR